MSEIDWSILAAKPALDPVTAYHIGDQDDAQRSAARNAQAQTALAAQKYADDKAANDAARARYTAAGDLYRKGDYQGAQAEMISTGNHEMVNAGTSSSKETYAQRTGGLQAVGGFAKYVMEHISDPEERKAVIAHNAPLLKAAGAHDDDIAAVVSDPSDAVLGGVVNQFYAPKDQDAARVAQQNADTTRMTAENPVVVGQSLVTRGGQELFRAPDYINAAPGNNVIEVGGASANGYTSQSSIKPGSVTAEQLYRAAIEPQESGGRAGAIGPQTKYGRAQGASQMLPATAQSMAQKLGIAWRPELMTAKSQEGLAYQRKLGIAYTQTALDANGGDPRKAAEFYHGGPDTSIHGPKTRAYGDQVMSRLDRVINPQSTTRQTRVIQQGRSDSELPAGSTANGKAYLDTLPPDHRAMVVAIAEGRAAPPKSNTKLGQQLLQEVTAYDPTFDVANATTRVATRKSYTSGAMSNNRTSMNTAIGHMLHLDDQAKKLNNFSVAPGLLNPAYNAARSAMGNTALPAFEQTKQAVGSEMRKVFAGASGGSVSELNEWLEQLNSSKSYDQLHAVIGNGVKLLDSRLQANRQQYAEGMGRSDAVPRFITDDNIRGTKARFGVQLNDGSNLGQHPQQQQQSSGGRKPPPVGFTTTRNGKSYTWTGKNWVAR